MRTGICDGFVHQVEDANDDGKVNGTLLEQVSHFSYCRRGRK